MRTRDIPREPDTVADRLGWHLGVVVDHESAAERGHPGRAGVKDMETAVGQRAVIARSHDQVPAPRPTVRARQAEVGDPVEPHVIDCPQQSRRRSERRYVEHHGPTGQVDETPEVDGVAVRGEKQRRRVHQLREEGERVVLSSGRLEATAQRGQRRAGKRVDERLHPVHEIQMVVQQLRRRLGRCPVAELQRPQTALHPVRRRDRLQGLRRNPIPSVTAHRILRSRCLC